MQLSLNEATKLLHERSNRLWKVLDNQEMGNVWECIQNVYEIASLLKDKEKKRKKETVRSKD